MPSTQKVHEEYADQPVTVFRIDVWERKPDAGPRCFLEKEYTYGRSLECEELANVYGVTGIPTVVVIDRDGKVVLIETGFGPEGDKHLRAMIDGVLAK